MKRVRAADHPLTGIGLAFLSAFIFSLLNLAIRYAGPYLTVWHMMLGRSLFGVIVLIIVARVLNVGLLGRRRATLVGIGLTGMGSLTCLVAALVLVPLVQALLLFYLYIAFAALFSPWLTREKMTPHEWLLIGLAFLGTALVLWPKGSGHELKWGHFVALAAAFGYGLTMTLIRRVSTENNPMTPYFYVSVVGCVICPIFLLGQDIPLAVGAGGAIGLMTIAILATAAHLTINKALAILPSPKVGVISQTEIVLGGIYGYVLFGESMGWHALIGGLLILSSGVGLNLKIGRRP